jgi:hypothetical protein
MNFLQRTGVVARRKYDYYVKILPLAERIKECLMIKVLSLEKLL